MQKTSDIVHLFQEFGGKTESYREIAREQDASQARARWPLISALAETSGTLAPVPPVSAGEDASSLGQLWHSAKRFSAPDEPVSVRPASAPQAAAPAPASAVPVAPLFAKAAPAVPAPAEAPMARMPEPSVAEAAGPRGPSPLALLGRRPAAFAAPVPVCDAPAPERLSQVFGQLLAARGRS